MIIVGDCREVMRTLDEASVDAIVCDPPYGLEFMGKEWDRLGDVRQRGDATFQEADVKEPFGRVRHGNSASYRSDPSTSRAMQSWHESWAVEAFRVLRPGGHLLAFGGSRTFHRLTVAIEDAGFEIRDCLSWLYGSGFPKSLDVSKAIDKMAGAERQRTGNYTARHGVKAPNQVMNRFVSNQYDPDTGKMFETTPATPEAAHWAGWGTALKPAWEPVIVARKPLVGTVAANVLQHGTGALNIDATRIPTEGESTERPNGQRGPLSLADQNHRPYRDAERDAGIGGSECGRWPANVVLSHHEDCRQIGTRRVKSNERPACEGKSYTGSSPAPMNRANGKDDTKQATVRYADADGMETVAAWECHPDCAVALLDQQSGERGGGFGVRGKSPNGRTYAGGKGFANTLAETGQTVGYGDTGGASRFFYTAKASRSERNAGLEGMPERDVHRFGAGIGEGHDPKAPSREGNVHPTVKPIALMRWLVRLVTPPGGLVLDPFMGSGSTGCAAALEGFAFIGIEQDAEYAAIAERRIAFWRANGDRPVKGETARTNQGVYANGKGRKPIARCPEHGESRDGANGDRTYKCGCRRAYSDYTAGQPRPTMLQPSLPLEGVAD